MNLTKDIRGTTLIELIVVISTVGFLAFMAGVGLVVFFAKWTELNLYSDLQIDAFNAIYAMKHGIITGGNEPDFYGIATADSVSFRSQSGGANVYRAIHCAQSTGETIHQTDWADFWWDTWEGTLNASYKYYQDEDNFVLFPVEHADDIRVTNLSFQPIGGSNEVVEIVLEAQIQITDDKVRKVKYVTQVAIGVT